MLKQKRKFKNEHRAFRRTLLYVIVSCLSLMIGIIGTALLMPPKEVPYSVNGAIVDTTPTGVFYAVFATDDIPCGTLILPSMVVETLPEQIAVQGYYPVQPVWQLYHSPELATLYESVARYDLPRGTRISPQAVISQDEPLVCPTSVSDAN